MYVYIYVSTCVSMCVYVCMGVCMYISMFVCVYVRMCGDGRENELCHVIATIFLSLFIYFS